MTLLYLGSAVVFVIVLIAALSEVIHGGKGDDGFTR